MILGRCNYPYMSSFSLCKYEMANKFNGANVVKKSATCGYFAFYAETSGKDLKNE